LKYGNPTVVNVILNIQPVISTISAFVLFGDRLARQFFLYAGIAIVAGIFVSVAYPAQVGVSFERAGLNLSLKTCFSNLHGLWHNPFTQL
jgi:drug/metabolite transporter (DMT)-like permease